MKRKDLILQTALAMFNEKGVMNVGVREIAREMNISVGNLSYHFPRKEDIISTLLGQMRDHNSQLYARYGKEEPDPGRFLELLKQVMENQFGHRGILVGNQGMQKILQEDYDYEVVKESRKATFRSYFEALAQAGFLSFSPEDLEFLVSWISLFGRFWIHEVFVESSNPSREDQIAHYLRMFQRQLLFLATEKGRKSMMRFPT